jgi:hypothetical protein
LNDAKIRSNAALAIATSIVEFTREPRQSLSVLTVGLKANGKNWQVKSLEKRK